MPGKRHTVEDEAAFAIRSFAAVGLPGRPVAPHAHPWHQLILAVGGVVTVRTAHGLWVVPPHWAIWAPAGVAHGMAFAARTELRMLYVRPGERPDLPSRSAVMAVPPLLRELIGRAVELRMLDRREPVHAALVLLILDALRERPVAALDLPLPASAPLRAIATALLGPPAACLSVEEAARRARLGLRTFERRFQAETGLSFGRWQRQARLTEAMRQLAAGHSVKAVAQQAGYRSPSAFVDAFAKLFGTTPGRYFSDGPRPPALP